MRFFTCLIAPDGSGIPDSVRRRYESFPRSRGLHFRWDSMGPMVVLVGWDDQEPEQLVARNGSAAAVGIVRLDNRADLELWSGPADQGPEVSDLELMLRVVLRHDDRYVSRFLGDFAFVVWNGDTRTAVAACDAFAARKLYYLEQHGLIVFASRGEVLAQGDRYEVQYLAERVAACVPEPGLSVFVGVKLMQAGTVAVLDGRGKLSTRQYWSPFDDAAGPAWAQSEHDAAMACRQLLAESVRLRLSGKGETWAQLSGGIDSSSVVSIAQWLAEQGTVANGLAGTVTYVDTYGTGADEREYSNAVVRRWRIRNETIVDAPIWEADGSAFPRLDEPSADVICHPRDRSLCTLLRSAGGRVLLTGGAGDSLFTGNMFFFADRFARGRIWSTLRDMASRAAVGRVSFWELAYRNALLPLLPRVLQHRWVRDQAGMPPWVLQSTALRYGLARRASAPRSYAGRLGHKYHDAVALGLAEVAAGVPVGLLEDTLDVRHPFLYRPLVEFALRLPPELCARPYARKWVLREAMRGILPDAVRTRVGKGAVFGRFAWSLAAQRALLEPLTQAMILEDLGVIDGKQLRAAFVAAPHERDGRVKLHAAVQHTLALEAWLQSRSGRWPCGAHSTKVA